MMAVNHDSLCVTLSGLAYCWCMCSKCWHGEGQVRPPQKMSAQRQEEYIPKPKGRCVCQHCPCHYASPLPLPLLAGRPQTGQTAPATAQFAAPVLSQEEQARERAQALDRKDAGQDGPDTRPSNTRTSTRRLGRRPSSVSRTQREKG